MDIAVNMLVHLKNPPEPVNLKTQNTDQDAISPLLTYFWNACSWRDTLRENNLKKSEFESIMAQIETDIAEWKQERIPWQEVLQQLATLIEENLQRKTGKNVEVVI